MKAETRCRDFEEINLSEVSQIRIGLPKHQPDQIAIWLKDGSILNYVPRVYRSEFGCKPIIKKIDGQQCGERQ